MNLHDTHTHIYIYMCVCFVKITLLHENAESCEIEDKKTTEHSRLSQCDRTQPHTEEVERKQTVQIQISYYSKWY